MNVGIATVVEFLQKKGHTVEANPNTKISEEQYAILVKEFSTDKNLRLESERFIQERQNKERNKASVSIEGFEKQPEKPKSEDVIKTVVPEDARPKFKPVGKIDLDKLNGRKPEKVEKEPEQKQEVPVVERPVVKPEVKKEPEKREPEVKKEEVVTPPVSVVEPTPVVVEPVVVPEPVVETKPVEVEKVVEEVKKEEPKVVVAAPVKAEEHKEEEKVETAQAEVTPVAEKAPEDDGVFKIRQPELGAKINVIGQIDLAALNQSTRPKKKSKEEKRREREEKEKIRQDQKKLMKEAIIKEIRKDDSKVVKNGPKESADAAKKKRNRIKKDRVDVNNTPGTNARPSRPNDDRKPRLRKPVKAEISEEDVQKQVKETLARLTNKGNKNNKGAKYRRDKRDAIQKREHELMEQEEMESKVLKLTEFVTANDLANMMDVSVTEVIGTCMSIGLMVSINQRLDAETINIVAEEFGYKTEYVSADVVEAINADEEDDNEEDWVARPPIVTVMGHVDHGKTSLLDNIRSANVIAGEAGGITQHIGAYNVKLQNGRRITFLDTPGHEAFTAMRARGAKVTDIAIIIVAADDNVMPQTIEAINHASAAGVPIVFAINKIDKPHANPEKIKEELANMNYLVEDWGGKYQSQEISAKKGIGVEELLEKVLLEADLLDLKANPKKRAVGSIIESSLDKGRGYVSTILVENGTLKMGDIVLAGTHQGRIKAMFNERNQRVEKAGPSEPVLILGLNGAPQAGDTFNVLETEQEAREIANRREQLQRELGLRTQKMLTLDDIGRRIAVGNFQELNVIVKGDVDGSVEALSDSLIRLSTEEIQVNVIHKAVGQISESDVVLAAASNAIIIGFQVRPSLQARRNAEKEGVEIRLYSIIYDAIEEVKSAMEGMLSPEIKEEITAYVEVQQVFKITKVGTVAGCMVKEGKIKRTNKIRLIRDGIVIYAGELGSLKRFKDDAKEVVAGLDCGLNITNFNDIQVGDMIEAYEETEIKKTL